MNRNPEKAYQINSRLNKGIVTPCDSLNGCGRFELSKTGKNTFEKWKRRILIGFRHEREIHQ